MFRIYYEFPGGGSKGFQAPPGGQPTRQALRAEPCAGRAAYARSPARRALRAASGYGRTVAGLLAAAKPYTRTQSTSMV